VGMPKTENVEFKYQIVKHRRAKRVRITVKSGGEVVVTVPWWTPKLAGERFLKQNWEWVTKKAAQMNKINPTKTVRHTKKQIAIFRLQARNIVEQRLEFFNRYYNFDFNKITIRNQKTRWGSCSSDRNLNFNYRIVTLPQNLADYLVVHELCHLKEMNHSSRFWELVGKTIPDYKKLRKQLRAHDLR